jgi:HIV Tat-specific factor 1
VTGLPEDIDADELRKFFSRYGIIAESLDDNGKRIKLYNDKDGKFKGEALISTLPIPNHCCVLLTPV